MHNHANATSTTMWTQPQTEAQKRYYSKHSPKRKVYGWIQTLLQTAHGFLAFAAWTALFMWVFKNVPAMMWLAPVLSISTLFALHILFRTTWETFWYDRLDDDPNTDSSVWIPVAIMAMLLIAEIRGATMFLESNVKPIERADAAPIEQQHATTLASMQQAYANEKDEIEAIYKQKAGLATASIDRQIRAAKAQGEKTGQLEAQRRNALAPILSAKAAAIEKAFNSFNAQKDGEINRRTAAVTAVDDHNANEAARYTSELGSVGTYAWVLSVGLLLLISMLGYARVRINVMSGILPLRNYTVLDAHGSVVERLATAFGDIVNRRTLQLAVWIHKAGSPKEALRTFDGTVVARPGEYNTPEGFLPEPKKEATTLPQATDEEALLRQKVFDKIAEEAKKGKVVITADLLEEELKNARIQNGTYKLRPLGKPEPSANPAAKVEGNPHPADQTTYNDALQYWASRVTKIVSGYDAAVLAGDPVEAKQFEDYLNKATGPIQTEAFRLGIAYGIEPEQPEIMVWRREKPSHKVPISKLTEQALNATISDRDDQPVSREDEELFKQSIDLFKQSIEPQYDANGQVIGVKYRKTAGSWVVYARPQVEAFVRTYGERAVNKPSIATKSGAEKWRYALSLFDMKPETVTEDLQPINL